MKNSRRGRAVRVIFLDIDGVLNQCDWKEGDPRPATCPSCVRQLNRVLKETGASVVLVSNWRHLVNRGDITPKGFEFLLHTHGVVGAHIRHVMGEGRKRSSRGGGITRWLRQHPEVESFVIMDDLPEGQEPEWVEERLVRVNGTGIDGRGCAEGNRAAQDFGGTAGDWQAAKIGVTESAGKVGVAVSRPL